MVTALTDRTTGTLQEHIRADFHRLRAVLVLPPILALVYPFLLDAFHASVAAVLSSGGVAAWSAAAITLILSFAMPIAALLIAMSLAALESPTAAQRKARNVALLAVAAPPIFVFLGVVLDMLHSPIPDTWFWVAAWAAASIVVALADNTSPIAPLPVAVPRWLGHAHGVSAAGIILLFLAWHLTNHLFFVEGKDDYMLVMKLFRHVYRGGVAQPILLALLLFQIVSGIYLAIGRASHPMDKFRSLQVATGVYLAFYIVGHLDSVFIFARTFLHIDSDWGFATGAPTGLIKDPWNIRLVPHYGLAVFFVLTHLFGGLRIVMLAHGTRERIADRVMIGGAVAAAVTAAVIMLGMCGMRVSFEP